LGHSEADVIRFAKIFDDATIGDMVVILPGLLDLLSPTRELPTWTGATKSQRQILYDFYHEYRLRKANTREIVVDTNNVVLNLHVGTGSAMEPFKRLHRYVDARKALTEERQAATEANRRAKRVESLDYTDPDTDRTVIIPEGRETEALHARAAEKETKKGPDA
jgi:hypothetical protein